MSFTAVTVTVNVWLNEALSADVAKSPSIPASSTVTVMMAVPVWLATGVYARLPVAPGEL